MRLRYLIVFVTLVLSVTVLAAQGDACPVLVEQALLSVGDNCMDLDRNSACYGYNRVEATFASTQPAGYFSQPADQAPLAQLTSIQTAAFDSLTQEWGVAVMNVQANIPNTLPGQSVTFLLMGDAELTNQVQPDTAFIPAEPVTVTAQSNQAMHQSPSAATAVIAQVTGGTVMMADGLSIDQTWARVTLNEQVGWVPISALGVVDLTGLPVIRSSNQTPMQAFYFSPGVGQPQCQEALPVLAIQSPDNITVELTMNGLDIRVGSMVTVYGSGENNLVLTVQEGKVETADGKTVETGQSLEAHLDQQGNITGWEPIRPATDTEKQLGLRVERSFTGLGLPLSVSAIGEPSATEEPVVNDDDGPLYHIVVRGDTLFSIARTYETGMLNIMTANGLTDPALIYVGQQLLIPNPGSGFVGLPTTQPGLGGQGSDDETTSNETDSQPVCSGFKQTSPVGASAPGNIATYYWDPAPGATRYNVNFYDYQGNLAGTLSTAGAETNIQVELGRIGVGGAFQWEVVAFVGDTQICSTGLSNRMEAEAGIIATEEPVIKPEFTAELFCSGSYQASVTFDNAPTTPVTITYQHDGYPDTKTSSATSGTVTLNTGYYYTVAQITSGSQTITLGGATCP